MTTPVERAAELGALLKAARATAPTPRRRWPAPRVIPRPPLVVWLEDVHRRHELAAALRVEAERALLHWPNPYDLEHNGDLSCDVCRPDGSCECCADPREWPCYEWRLIASGWRDQPGYLEEWAP